MTATGKSSVQVIHFLSCGDNIRETGAWAVLTALWSQGPLKR